MRIYNNIHRHYRSNRKETESLKPARSKERVDWALPKEPKRERGSKIGIGISINFWELWNLVNGRHGIGGRGCDRSLWRGGRWTIGWHYTEHYEPIALTKLVGAVVGCGPVASSSSLTSVIICEYSNMRVKGLWTAVVLTPVSNLYILGLGPTGSMKLITLGHFGLQSNS